VRKVGDPTECGRLEHPHPTKIAHILERSRPLCYRTQVLTTLLLIDHDLECFVSDSVETDEWLKQRAHAHQVSGGSQTYVTSEGRTVLGCYTLSAGTLADADAPGHSPSHRPDPIPLAVLDHLAVDRSRHGTGLESALVHDAVTRAREAAENLRIRGLLVRPTSPEARIFYQRHGFLASPLKPELLLLSFVAVQ
jgi:ribosomal protein S18 acetylase RimI-like enzyme